VATFPQESTLQPSLLTLAGLSSSSVYNKAALPCSFPVNMDHASAVALQLLPMANGNALFSSCVDALKALVCACLFYSKELLVTLWVALPKGTFLRDWSCLGSSEGCMTIAGDAIMGGFSVSWGVLTAFLLVTLALLVEYWSRQAGPTVVLPTSPPEPMQVRVKGSLQTTIC
jgi:hypothetical protein